jgi:hypothetical protein
MRIPLVLSLVLLLAVSSFAADPKLVAANTPAWSTSFLGVARPDLAHTATIRFGRCTIGPVEYEMKIVPGGANIVRNIGQACVDPFSLLPVPSAAVDVVSILSFRNGPDHSSFTLPPIGAISGSQTVRVGPLVVDDTEGAWLTLFVDKPSTPIFLTWVDAKGDAAPISEAITVNGPVTQIHATWPGVWWLDVKIGNGIPDPYACWPAADCSAFGDVYGFATSGTPEGGNMRVYPFQVVAP